MQSCFGSSNWFHCVHGYRTCNSCLFQIVILNKFVCKFFFFFLCYYINEDSVQIFPFITRCGWTSVEAGYQKTNPLYVNIIVFEYHFGGNPAVLWRLVVHISVLFLSTGPRNMQNVMKRDCMLHLLVVKNTYNRFVYTSLNNHQTLSYL